MSFTRYHDETCRIEKQLQESTDPGRYILNTPGNGDKPCYYEDPFIRLEKWGANLNTNSINLESDLMGLSRNLNKDTIKENNYKKYTINSHKITYPNCKPFVIQSRTIMPPWTVNDLEQNNFDYLFFDPQSNIDIPFYNNISTRILEKDYYLAKKCLPNSTLFN